MRVLADLGDKVQDDERKSIEAAIESLKEALKAEDKDEIEAKSKALAEASAGLAQRIYEEQAQSAGSEEAAAGAQGPAGGDDVVDAEFEEVKEDKAKDA